MIYEESKFVIKHEHFYGSRKLNFTINNAAAVNNGGYAEIPITGHGLNIGTWIRIAGSVAYNGVWYIRALNGANAIVIEKLYVAEAFAGTETYAVCLKPDADFELVETRLTLSVASAAENYVTVLVANVGAAWNATLDTSAMNGLTEKILIWIDANKRRFMERGDIIYWTYANTNNATWGLTAIWRRRA